MNIFIRPDKVCYILNKLESNNEEKINRCMYRTTGSGFKMSEISDWKQKLDTASGHWEDSEDMLRFYNAMFDRFNDISK